jgi:hypothetical protein
MVKRSKKELLRIGELYLLERGTNRGGCRKTDTLKVGSESWPYHSAKGDNRTPSRVTMRHPKGDNRTVSQVVPQPSYSSEPKENLARSSPDLSQLPADLQTNPELQTAWTAWIQHRSEIRKKLTPSAAQEQIKQIRQWGPDRAVAAIHHSIAGSYQGIFEPNHNQKKPSRPVDEFGYPKL